MPNYDGMQAWDDSLIRFEREGTPPLPTSGQAGHVETDGARIWYASMGKGPAVILLHGGLGHSGNWAYQVPALLAAGYRVVTIDTRGHGRSSRDARTYSYQLLADDVLAVMDALALGRAALVGWSDGACTGMILADRRPERVDGLFYFACNMDPDGARPFVPTPVIDRCFARHRLDYAAISATPAEFEPFVAAVSQMQRTEPNYDAGQLSAIAVPTAIVIGEHDEFIRPEHAHYLAATLPNAELITLPNVSHFAPLQRPQLFNAAMLQFLTRLPLHPPAHPPLP